MFDPDMVPTHTDTLMRSFWPEACAAGKKWVVQEAKPKWKAEQIKEALQICDLIDQRWEAYGKQRDAALLRTACTATVWPEPGHTPAAVKPGPSLAEQEKEKADLESTSNSFQRLKLVMDAWCALWFWPLQRVADLPSRDAFLTSARLLLGAEPPKDKHLTAQMSLRLGFEVDGLLAGIGAGQIPDVEILSSNVPWYDLARTLSDEQNFHHWELVYPEVLGPHPERRGFDLIVGNPPWLKVTWSEAATLCELDAKLGVEEASAAALSKNQLRLLDNKTTRRFFGDAYRNATGGIACMKSMRMYGVLSTIQTNIYKCFILKAWDLLAPNGFAGLIYEDGVYDAPKGGALRELSFPRLRSHFQFRNELQLFPDVGHAKTFCLSVYAGTPRAPTFKTIANLFHPKSIEQCLSHRSATDPVPGIKSDDGNWETRGHISRVLCIDADALSLFNSVYEEEGGPWLQTRLPHIHSSELMSVLQKLTSPKKWLDRIRNDYHATEMFHETEAQRDGVITRASAPSFSPQLD